jgi:hypothetical protein
VDDRVRRALRALLRWAAGDGGSVVVRVTPKDGGWRFSMRGPSLADDALDAVADLVRPVGGDAGSDARDDHTERWITAPRA